MPIMGMHTGACRTFIAAATKLDGRLNEAHGKAERLSDIIVGARFEAEDGVGIGVVAREHDDRRLETVPAQDAHGLAAVDVGQADIHDHQIDLSRLGGLHALAAVLRRDSFKLLVQRKLLRQRVAQFWIIVDNENLTGIRHQFRPPQPLARMGILPADTKSIKDIMTRDDIFPSLLVARALVRLPK